MAPVPRSGGVVQAFSATLASARATLADFLELVALEARRAGLALAWMLAFGVGIAICAVAAWLGLMVALVLWAVSLGLPAIAAVLALVLLNLTAAAALTWACVGLTRDLMFDATRRQVAETFPAGPSAS